MLGGLELVSYSRTLSVVLIGFVVVVARADQTSKPSTAEDILAAARDSVAVIFSKNRDGDRRGTGTGFVVGADGVIATNYHVIGDRRRFDVRLSDGKNYEPVEILAADSKRDIAIFRIEAKDLKVLELGNSDELDPGQPIVSIGNPLGLEWSASTGVVAASRIYRERPLVQVAITIEPGSSGSPVIDMSGKVIGMITIKSGEALGFAVPSNDIRRLVLDPHPIPMERWATIGALDTSEWAAGQGGQWRQRAGRLIATGQGDGFAGRMLCLNQTPPPAGEFELEVEVRLDEESGAAGLAFHSDGNHNHYGFYPTNGAMRLTRFEGPAVYDWTILQTVASDAYTPGEWNRIKLSADGSHIVCSVNGTVVIDVEDGGLSTGKVGLVKFRAPSAEFRNFRIGQSLKPLGLNDKVLDRVREIVQRLGESDADTEGIIGELEQVGAASVRAVIEHADYLEKRAVRLRRLSKAVHERVVQQELTSLLSGEESSIDLLHAALLISKLDNRDLAVQPYLDRADRMAKVVRGRVGDTANDADVLAELRKYLFDELGFRGSYYNDDYYTRANSYLDEVFEDREGLPIALSVIFMEIARRLDLTIDGVGIPVRFIVGYGLGTKEEKLIDVFGGGRVITRAQAAGIVGRTLEDSDFRKSSESEIISRMFRNLRSVAEREQDLRSMLRYTNALVAVDDSSAHDRWQRAQVQFQLGEHRSALADLEWLLEANPPGFDRRALENLRKVLTDLVERTKADAEK